MWEAQHPMQKADRSPLAPHAATPAELRERIEAERAGVPFLVLRDGDVLRVGRTQIAYRVPDASVSSPTAVAGSRPELPELSATQRAVLAALCRPYKATELATPATNQQIADELYLSVDAVKAHLRTLFGYFGVEHLPQNQKRSYLAMRALQDGVVSRRDL